MADEMIFEIEDGVLVKYNGGEVAVVPEGVERIGAYSFIGNDTVRKVVIPSGVTCIEQQAFRGCDSLSEVVLPSGLEAIERFAFCSCGQLKDITIPETVTEIGNSAFRGCDLISGVSLPKGLKRLGESAFSDCRSLESAVVSGTVGVIRKRTFSGCRAMKELTVGEGITLIDDYAFECCSSLEEAKLPDSVNAIGHFAFRGCSSLVKAIVPESVEHIGSGAFENTPIVSRCADDAVVLGNGVLVKWCCETENITVPEGIRVVGENAFSSLSQLKSVSLPETVVEISDLAFEKCTELETVILPQSLKTIGDRAFVDCTSLAGIKLPGNVKRIGSDAFYNTMLLESYNEDTVIFNSRYLIRCSVNSESFTVPDGVVLIADNAFAGAIGVQEITFAPTVKYIGNNAFRWLGSLKKAVIPDSVESIGSDAFMACTDLDVTLSMKGKTLGNSVLPSTSRVTFVCGEKRFTVRLEDALSGNDPIALFAQCPCADSFCAISSLNEKVPAAVCFTDDIKECDEFLDENIADALCYAVISDDMPLLTALLETDKADATSLDKAIDRSMSDDALEFRVKLMDKKRLLLNGKSLDSVIDDMFSI